MEEGERWRWGIWLLQHISLRYDLIIKHQFSRQDHAAREGREGSYFDLICTSDLWSGQITLSLVLQDLLFLMADEVGMGVIMDSSRGWFDSITVFNARMSLFLARSYHSRPGTFLNARREKEAWGYLEIPPMKHSSFWSSDLFLGMKGQWCAIITIWYVLGGPSGFLEGMFWLEMRKLFI